jgi:hypothetical protein
MTAWLDYIDARRRLIHEWHAQGIDPVDIAFRFELDLERVSRIIRERVDPPLPGTARAVAAELRERVARLERALHGRESESPLRRCIPTVSQIQALLSNPDPAICGCQFLKQEQDPVIASDEHHVDCPFAPKARD